jgi:hypothetical protein
MYVEIFFTAGFAPCINLPSGSILEEIPKQKKSSGDPLCFHQILKKYVSSYLMVFAVRVWKFIFTKYGPVNLGSIFNFSDNFFTACRTPCGINGGATYWY